MATFLPFPLFPVIAPRPKLCAVAQGPPPPIIPPPPPRSSAALRPDVARTESSAASSINFRILVTLRNTPGSMGGGVALPGFGGGMGAGIGSWAYEREDSRGVL